MTEQEELIWAKIQKEQQQKVRAKSFEIISRILLLFTVGLFMFSPCFQLILRMTSPIEAAERGIYHDLAVYQDMILKVNILALLTAVLCYGYYAVKIIHNRRSIGPLIKNNWKRMIPLLLMWLFAVTVPVVTLIRGANEYDLTGHPYMYESIFSYMLYPTCYFFCGAMLWQSKYKRILLYLLIFSAMPINILALINEWVTKVPFFYAQGVSTVFHNSNHYGYYLMLVIIASLILFVYEVKIRWKIINALSAFIGTMVLIINNTFGAYLAIMVVLIAFFIYCLITDRKRIWWALGAILIFFVATLCLSFSYNTIISSFVVLRRDIGMIASDPLESDQAGSQRWVLWKGTVASLGESPWLGFGVEGLLHTHHVGTPHNEILQYSEFFGIPAMLMYLSAVITVFITILKHSKIFDSMTLVCFCVSVGYFVSSMFGVAIYYTTPFFYIFLGLTYAEWLHKGPGEKKENR